MASVLNDDIRYVKIVLLLLKGGTFSAKRLILKISTSDNKCIDYYLKGNQHKLESARRGNHISQLQIEVLFPSSKPKTNLECWDISLLSYVLLNLFDNKLESHENIAIVALREKRNELLHRASIVMSEVQFLGEWAHLTMVLYQLTKGLTTDEQDEINATISKILQIQDFHFATNELKSFEGSDELAHTVVTENMKCIEQKLTEYGNRLANVEAKMDILLDMKARFTVDGSQSERDKAQAKLLDGFQRCLSDKKDHNNEQDHTSEQDQDNDDEVLADIKSLFSDMEKQGVDIVNVEEGSILVTFRCTTTSALKSIVNYLFDRMYEERLITLENALSEYVKSPIKLNISIVLETLHAALMQIEKDTKNKSIVLTLQCRGSEGVKNAIDCFRNGSSTNTLNGLSEALIKYVGQKVELNTTIDVDKLEHDITELERQLILGDQNSEHESPKRMKTSFEIFTTELLPNETAPSESSPRTEHSEAPSVACTKPSSPYSSQKLPHISMDRQPATIYRQEIGATRHTFRTALAFDTEICEEHGMYPDLTKCSVDVMSWLTKKDLISVCEQFQSRRATLQEIESCYSDVDVLFDTILLLFSRHLERKDAMKLNELPCGCIEVVQNTLGPIGCYIPVTALRAAGCVTDMAYRVGTGELNNGIVLVTTGHGSHGLGMFQLSTVAVAAKQMKEKLNMKRILIIDLNGSHGMSTQRATYDDKSILYIYIHYKGSPTQENDESHSFGSRDAEGFNINIALDVRLYDTDYLMVFRSIVYPIAREFSPEIVMVSGGVGESYRKNFPVFNLLPFDCGLSPESLAHMTSELMSMFNGKVVLVIELEEDSKVACNLAEMCLKALLGRQFPANYNGPTLGLESLERTILIQLKYWPCLRSHLSSIQTLLEKERAMSRVPFLMKGGGRRPLDGDT